MTMGEPAPTLVGLTMVKKISTYFSSAIENQKACRHGFFTFQNGYINYFLNQNL